MQKYVYMCISERAKKRRTLERERDWPAGVDSDPNCCHPLFGTQRKMRFKKGQGEDYTWFYCNLRKRSHIEGDKYKTAAVEI